MQTILLNNKEYFLIDDIIKNAPKWCSNIADGKTLIKNKQIKRLYIISALVYNGK